MSLSERIRPNSEAAPWVCEEVKKLECKLAQAKRGEEVANRDFRMALESLTKARLELAAERAIVDWLGSPEGRRYQTANPEATLYRETILSAMKGARYAD